MLTAADRADLHWAQGRLDVGPDREGHRAGDLGGVAGDRPELDQDPRLPHGDYDVVAEGDGPARKVDLDGVLKRRVLVDLKQSRTPRRSRGRLTLMGGT